MDLLQSAHDATTAANNVLTLNLDALVPDSLPPLTFLADASLWFEEHARKPHPTQVQIATGGGQFEIESNDGTSGHGTATSTASGQQHVSASASHNTQHPSPAYMTDMLDGSSRSHHHTSTGASTNSPHYTQLGNAQPLVSPDDYNQQADRLEVARIMEQLKKGWDGTATSNSNLPPAVAGQGGAASFIDFESIQHLSNNQPTGSTGLTDHNQPTRPPSVQDDTAGITCRFDNSKLHVDLRPLFTEELRQTMQRNAATRVIVPVQLRFPFGYLTIRLPCGTLWPASRGPTLVPPPTMDVAKQPLLITKNNETSDKNGNKAWKCHLCDKKLFSNRYALQLHLRTHNDHRPFACSICSKQFRQKSHLHSHMLLHTNTKPFKCRHCNRRFTQKPHLSRHEGTCGSSPGLKCTVNTVRQKQYCKAHNRSPAHRAACSECSHGVTQLSRHLRTVHSDERPHICTECGAEFKLAHHLKTHMAVHSRHKSNVCDLCDAAFVLATHLKRHRQSVHKIGLVTEHRCNDCEKTFARLDSLRDHQRANHRDSNNTGGNDPAHRRRLPTCDVCGVVFVRPSKLREHKRKRHQQNSNTNPMVIKTPTSTALPSVHSATDSLPMFHATNKNNVVNKTATIATIPCPNCTQKFTRATNMRRHLAKCPVKISGVLDREQLLTSLITN